MMNNAHFMQWSLSCMLKIIQYSLHRIKCQTGDNYVTQPLCCQSFFYACQINFEQVFSFFCYSHIDLFNSIPVFQFVVLLIN